MKHYEIKGSFAGSHFCQYWNKELKEHRLGLNLTQRLIIWQQNNKLWFHGVQIKNKGKNLLTAVLLGLCILTGVLIKYYSYKIASEGHCKAFANDFFYMIAEKKTRVQNNIWDFGSNPIFWRALVWWRWLIWVISLRSSVIALVEHPYLQLKWIIS